MQAYLDLVADVMNNGSDRIDRTGVGTRSVFGRQLRFDLQQGFPLVTTRHIHVRSIIEELLWFLRGDTNNQLLKDKGVTIWNPWALDNGDLGPIYGHQWRSWACPDGRVIDQITQVIADIRERPYSRRLVVTAWNPADLPDESISPHANVTQGKMAIAPCHCLFQFYIQNARLSCQLYQRSADLMIGVPFNIASYALLTHMIAAQTGYGVGEFIHTFGDLHIYRDHLCPEGVHLQLTRQPYALPKLKLNLVSNIFGYTAEDIAILEYRHHAKIKYDIAV